MKTTIYYLLTCVCAAMLALTSCRNEQEEPWSSAEAHEAVLMEVPIRIGQEPMEAKYASPDTRSLMPMGPEQENPMRTLAVVQFDSEGNMLEINKDNGTTHPHYHFRDLTSSENPSGVLNASLEGISLFSSVGRNTRVCLIANETEAGIDSLLWSKEENRRLLWNEFRVRTIEIPYKLPEKGNSTDSLGHVREIYMYGHYEGELDFNSNNSPVVGNDRELSVSLARMIARVEVNVKLGEGVEIPEGYRIFFGMYNVEQSAYLVPGAASFLTSRIHNHIHYAPVDRTDGLSKTASTYYFYVAPHIVQEYRKDVTYFAVWCVPSGVTADDLYNDMETNVETPDKQKYPCARILVCNDPLTDGDNPSADGAFWVNRNSIYHVNLTLTYQKNSRTARAGEYVIDLNHLMGRY